VTLLSNVTERRDRARTITSAHPGATSTCSVVLAFTVLTDHAERAALPTIVASGIGAPTAARASNRAQANRMSS